MTTRELLTILQEQFKGWNADGERGILPHLNAAHAILKTAKGEQNVYFDEASGRLPYLVTTDSDYDYDCGDNIWLLDGLLVEVEIAANTSGTLLSTLTGFDYGTRRGTSKGVQYETLAGIQYIRVPYVRSWPATETANCRLMFTANPGTTTTFYSLYGYRKPVQILSDTVQIEIEPPWDYMYLLPATAKLIEGIQHGNYVEARNYVLNVLKPAYQKEINAGEQGFDYETDDRGF